MLKSALLVVFPLLVAASELGPGLSLHYEYFKDANEVWSHTPGFDLRMEIAPKWSASISAEVDGVSGASRVNPPDVNAPDGISGASQQRTPTLVDGIAGASTVEFRVSQTTHITYSNAGALVSLGYYSSKEDDYFSSAPMLDLAYDLFDRNTTLGISLAYYDDRFVNLDVTPPGKDPQYPEGSAKKRLTSTQATLTQTLTRLTLVSLGVQRIYSWGYLGKPYNPILVKLDEPIRDGATGDVQYYDSHSEILPDQKEALVFSGSLVQGYTFFPSRLGSVRIQYRHYADDWKLSSHTLDNEWSQYLTETLYMRIRYRWYTQTRAEFVYNKYTGEEEYRTADIRYFPFTSNLVGLKFGGEFPETWQDGHWWVPAFWSIKGDFMIRNTKGNTALYQYYPSNENYYQSTVMTGVDYVF